MFMRNTALWAMLTVMGSGAFAQSGGNVGGGHRPDASEFPSSGPVIRLIRIYGPWIRWDRRLRLTDEQVRQLLLELNSTPYEEWPDEVMLLLQRSNAI